MGVLEPIFAIRTEDDLGVGDTDGARQMIDWCHRHRLNVFQTLPINETGHDNSPYNAISSLALEPSTIATTPRRLPDLPAVRFKELARPTLLAELRAGSVKYPRVKALKHALLEAAFDHFFKTHFSRDTARAKEFHAFIKQHSTWLVDYALFRVLMGENGDSPAWDRWPKEHQKPAVARAWLARLPRPRREELQRRQLFFEYVQWIAFSQWEEVHAHANARGVYLMGDVPFGVSRYSADTWANPAIFNLDWSGGAPPETNFKVDLFTEKWGQNWGIPIYRWDVLRKRNFDWWRTRIGTLCEVFHFFRIDHVLGFFRVYSFPWPPHRNAEFTHLTWEEAGAKTGGHYPGFKPFPDDTDEHRAFNQAQGQELLQMVLDAAGENTVIAEDLGVVPDYVAPTLTRLGIPGFRIPMFFREHHNHYSDPLQYPLLTIAQPATHDHPPLAAQWAGCWANIDAGRDVEYNAWELKHLMEFAGVDDEKPPRKLTDHILEAYTRALMQSRSWIVVFQITDVFGQSDRFNVPGSTADSNWSHRLSHTVRELDRHPHLHQRARTFSRLARESGRTA